MAVLIPDAIARPTSKTPAVRRKALEQLLPRAQKWLKQGAGDAEDTDESVLRDLDGALNGWNDGYQAARELETRSGWSPDSELVEILDGFSTYDAEKEAVQAWVKEVQPVPTFKLGDRVIWHHPARAIEGEIVKIMPEIAKYLVRGKDDVGEGQIGTQGTHVNWEDAQPCPQ